MLTVYINRVHAALSASSGVSVNSLYYHFTKMSRRHLHIVALLGMLILRLDLVFAYGCEWTGKMPGPGGGGSCPSPVQSETCPVTPSYEELQSMKVLWPCPNATKQTGEKYYGACTPGSGNNPLCYNFNPTTPQFGCCCPSDGCWTSPNFNWILGVCKGSGCGAYDNAPATQTYKNAGSELIVNYVASYQWNGQNWQLVPDSSFNTDGSGPAFDTMKPNGGMNKSQAWMQPQPGGSAAWTWGYYPAGVKGVGPPGIMFVLSVERVWNVAWYMLNQVTLDKGPNIPYSPSYECQYGNNNCWSAGNAGEIDFLEAVWTVNAGRFDDYRRLYATQWNQVGRSFIGDQGETCNADGGWFNEQVASNNYFLGTHPNTTEPYVYVAVIDKIGTFIYRIPSSEVDKIWPGLSRSTAACTLGTRPTQRPPNGGPPCDDSNPYCALFIPNCQAESWGGASAGHQGGANQGCKVNSQQGWCENWWSLFANTSQWLWPENGRRSVVRTQAPAAAVVMPWNYEMESWKVDWYGNPQYNSGCCIKNQGNCPT